MRCRRPGAALTCAAVLAVALAGCAASQEPTGAEASSQRRPTASAQSPSGSTTSGSPTDAPAAAASALPVPDGSPQVLVVSIDALNPDALRSLGAEGTPTIHRLFDEGIGTLGARSQVEQTVTLPNHTSMVTGRRINADEGGHGVTWNEDLPGRTVQAAAGEPVESIFTVAHAAGVSTALFSTKAKFSLFPRSWPDAVDQTRILDGRDDDLTQAVLSDLAADRGLTFWHLSAADAAGHASGFMGEAYLDAVSRLDGLLGEVMAAADSRDDLDDLVVVLTADHGGPLGATEHSARTLPANYTVPLVVWGPGVESGDLYDANPSRRDPGRTRPGYGARPQPIRNGEVGNLALSLLGLPAIPDSQEDRRQDLVVRGRER